MIIDAFRILVFLGWATNLSQAQTDAHPVYSSQELLGQFDPSSHPDFELIPIDYTKKTNIYLRKEALVAFESMYKAANDEGIVLEIISATRSFAAQRNIWNRKWNAPRFMGFQDADRAREILKYSSMPGTSRHHWGTDIDLNSLENEWFESHPGSEIYAWLLSNAPLFGYHQVYTDKTQGRTGYEEECWHWSYLPIAEEMWDQHCGSFTDNSISGFNGAQWADSLQIMKSYVQGVEMPPRTKDLP